MSKRRIIIAIILAIVTFLGVVFGVYLYKADGNLAEAALNIATDVIGDKDPIFVLVLGVSEDISTELTDTIILCGYNPDSEKAFMVSVPRDTFIGKSEAQANGYDKINALYQKDVNETVEAVERLTGINIGYYVVVKNTALPAIVDAIGNVEFDVPIDMDYDDPTQDLHIHLKKGLQEIDGDKAEQLLRFRHNNNGTSYPIEYGDNDYGRMRTQREFIKIVARKVTTWNSVSHIKDVATAIFNNVETDITLSNALGYAPHALKLDVESIRMEQLPGASDKINELWFYKANASKTKTLMDELILGLEMEDKEVSKNYTKQITKTSTDTKSTSTNVTNSTNTSVENTNTISKTCDHDYNIIVSEKDATCTEAGSITRKCSYCGDTKTQSIPVKDHNYVNGICTMCGGKDSSYSTNTNTSKNNNTSKENPNTNTTSNQHTHNYVETSRTEATCTKNGTITKKCTICDDIKNETIKAKGHNYSGATCTVCGAENPNYKQDETPLNTDTEEQTTPQETDTSSSTTPAQETDDSSGDILE